MVRWSSNRAGNVELHVRRARHQAETPVLEQVSYVQTDRAHQLVAAALSHLQVTGVVDDAARVGVAEDHPARGDCRHPRGGVVRGRAVVHGTFLSRMNAKPSPIRSTPAARTWRRRESVLSRTTSAVATDIAAPQEGARPNTPSALTIRGVTGPNTAFSARRQARRAGATPRSSRLTRPIADGGTQAMPSAASIARLNTRAVARHREIHGILEVRPARKTRDRSQAPLAGACRPLQRQSHRELSERTGPAGAPTRRSPHHTGAAVDLQRDAATARRPTPWRPGPGALREPDPTRRRDRPRRRTRWSCIP